MRFLKVHGAGNDFVLLPDLDDRIALTADLAAALCDRHRGIGADGVLRLAPARDGAGDVFMDYRNADGSVAEMCGNGVRCVAKYLLDRGLAGPDRVRVSTRAGVKVVAALERDGRGDVTRLRVDMGRGEVLSLDERVEVPGMSLRVTTVSMGNPHAVVLVEDVSAVRLAQLAPPLQERYPSGANVEVVTPRAPSRVAARIWERGVGETLASGTGASAIAVASHALGLSEDEVVVELPGGELLVEVGADAVHVTGPATEVAEGVLCEGWPA